MQEGLLIFGDQVCKEGGMSLTESALCPCLRNVVGALGTCVGIFCKFQSAQVNHQAVPQLSTCVPSTPVPLQAPCHRANHQVWSDLDEAALLNIRCCLSLQLIMCARCLAQVSVMHTIRFGALHIRRPLPPSHLASAR
jgi:hypothetical protein